MRPSKWLQTRDGREFLLREYIEGRRSLHDIAASLSTHPMVVYRGLMRHSLDARDKSEAQHESLESGRHPHPTRGRQRTEEEKQNIRKGVLKEIANAKKAKRKRPDVNVDRGLPGPSDEPK